jgi:hypothetical protein
MLKVPLPPVLVGGPVGGVQVPVPHGQPTGYTLLLELAPVWRGTEPQVRILAGLTYLDGSLIITPARKDIVREVVGMLRSDGFDYTVDFLTDAPNPEFVMWDQSALNPGRDKVARELIIQQSEDKGVKGVGKCRYCASTELVFATKQLRSGDEPATIFVRCVMCQKQWRE